MTDPAKLMTEAKAVLERAKQQIGHIPLYELNNDQAVIHRLAKIVAAMLAQEEARWGKDWLDTLPPTGA